MLKWGLAIFLVETTSKRIYKHNTEMGHFKLFSAKIEDHHSIMSLVGSTAFIRIVLDKCSNFWWSAILHIEKTTNYGEISLTPLYMGWCDPRAAASSVRTLYKRCYGCPVSLQPLSQHVALEPVWEPAIAPSQMTNTRHHIHNHPVKLGQKRGFMHDTPVPWSPPHHCRNLQKIWFTNFKTDYILVQLEVDW